MQVLHVVTFSCSATSRLVRLRSFAAFPRADERAAAFLVAQHSHVLRIAHIHLCVTLCDVEVDPEDEIEYDKSLDKRDPESKIQTVDVATLAPDIASRQHHFLACQIYRLLHSADLSSIPFREFSGQHDIQLHEVLHVAVDVQIVAEFLSLSAQSSLVSVLRLLSFERHSDPGWT